MAGPSKGVSYGDSNFEETLSKWFDEVESDLSDYEDYRDNDFSPESDHSSDSEIEQVDETEKQESEESSENEEGNETTNRKFYYGKNRYKWSAGPANPNLHVRTKKHNLVKVLPGLKGPAKCADVADPLKIWSFLFTEDMENEIILRTNEKILLFKDKYNDPDRTELRELTKEEFRAFLAILYYSAVFKSNDEDLQEMFATDGTGRDIFRCSMSLKRVYVLLACLRFDNERDREERKNIDRTAAISWIFEHFVKNCQNCYSMGELTCIDEMLIGFRGRCRFRMYIPNKPRKYGIKVMALTDARTHYFYNGYIYSGKDSDGFSLTDEERCFLKPTQSVLRLCRPIANSNRNVTADNWFSSIEVMDELRKKGLTYVGTLKRNKREIPNEFLPNRKRAEGSSIYGFTNQYTIVSYVQNKGKAVVLISSMHHTESADVESGKPEIITFYNQTKGGVDGLDQKCTTYSTNRRTRRWPMTIFFTILNVAAVNAHVLHGCYKNNKVIDRKAFYKILARQLMQPYLNMRLCNSRLPRELRSTIGRILHKPVPVEDKGEVNIQNQKRRRCGICDRSNDKKTKMSCIKCTRPMCGDCRSYVCKNCI